MSKTTFEMVKEFHEAFGHPRPAVPTLIDPQRLVIRRKWADEERVEFDEALAQGDIVGCADALADELYFFLGTCVEAGINIDAVLAAVHESNMTKLQHQWPHQINCNMRLATNNRCDCGKILYNDLGKVQKPEGWTGPEHVIAKILGVA